MIKEIHIFDCDGVLCDSSHRYRTKKVNGIEKIDLDYWIEHEDKTLFDKLGPAVEHFKLLCKDPSKYVLIATARIWCFQSASWAYINGLSPNSIVARRSRKDTRGGAAIKISHVKRLLNLKQFKNVEQVHVYEDNISYLKEIQKEFKAISHYYPSKQGH